VLDESGGQTGAVAEAVAELQEGLKFAVDEVADWAGIGA
jgi:hypothetical protein